MLVMNCSQRIRALFETRQRRRWAAVGPDIQQSHFRKGMAARLKRPFVVQKNVRDSVPGTAGTQRSTVVISSR